METFMIHCELNDLELDYVSGGGDKPAPAPAPKKEEPKKDPPKKEPSKAEQEFAASLKAAWTQQEGASLEGKAKYTISW